MRVRPVTLALLVLLLAVQAGLWLGKGSWVRLLQLQSELDDQQRANADAQARNRKLAAEVKDLKDGLETVEEKARSELGMVRQDEIYVQITPPR